MTIRVEWPMTLPSVANLRIHWRVKAKLAKAQRLTTALQLLTANVITKVDAENLACTFRPDRLAVRLTRIAPRALDDDNWVAAAKNCRDQVAAYLGPDDRSPRLRFEYAQAKGKAAMRIEFEWEPAYDFVTVNAKLAEQHIAAELRRLGGMSETDALLRDVHGR